MKLLLDERVPYRLRSLLVGHDVYRTAYLGWSSVRDSQLLQLAAENGFDAVITVDLGIEHQQNLPHLPIAVVILHTKSNDIDLLRQLVPDLLAILPTLSPHVITHIGQP
jgi:predicted nuclease of predicted toxin-antitoxin system